LGLVIRGEQTLSVAPEAHALPELEFHADLLRDLLEAYWLAARNLNDLRAPVDSKSFVRESLELGRAELLAGRIRAAEALNRTTLENAVAFFKDQSYLKEENKLLSWGQRGVDAAQRAELLQRLDDYVA
jgi:glycerol-3-phosphate O-acyltransferase